MSAGTITLTNNSAAVSGAGTAFTTDLKAGDFIVSVVGGVTYTLPVKTVNSATGVTLLKNYDGPTQAGAAWSAVPRDTMNAITAQLAAETAQALRGLNYDKQNWQQVFSGTGNITVKLLDGSVFTGPSWNSLAVALADKADKSSLGSASRADIGASLGNVMSVTQSGENSNGLGALYPNNQLNNEFNGARTGFFRQSAAQGADWYGNWGAGLIVNYSDPTKFLIFISQDSSIYASRLNGNSEVWRAKFWTSKNTTVTSDGTLKSASPIVNIFHDGTFETNEESEGAEVEHVSVGVYLIKNVLGMNADRAWGGNDGGFDIPKDKNGHALVWLDYKVESDGSILVKTYHRTYPDAPAFARNIKEGYEEGDLIDIPSDQFVSVRVEMPQDSIWNLAQKAAREEMEQEKAVEW